MKVLAVAMLCMSLSGLALADDEDNEVKVIHGSVVEVEQYNYGMDLDIKRVISIEGDMSACGLTPAEVVYEDSHGEVHDMKYMVMGYGCSNG